MNKVLVACMVCSGLAAQTRWESGPRGFENLPGNAGLSLPARWSVGLLQVLMETSVAPPSLTSSPLQRVRFRRQAFAGDPADPVRTIDCELRLADSLAMARQLTVDMAANRPASLTVAAARRVYNVPATPALGPADSVGADLIDLPLDAPFAFQGPSLFLEWQNYAPTQSVSTGHWVDAVHMPGGVDLGLAVQVGAHGCGSRGGTSTMTLQADTTAPPTLGTPFPVLVRNAAANAPGVVFTFVDPLVRGPLGLPFGQDLAAIGMPGCHLWAGPDIQTSVAANALGDARTSVTLPNLIVLRGRPTSMQGITLDAAANTMGVAASSGLVLRPDFVGVFDRAVSIIEFRDNSTVSPWAPFLGLTPVVLFGF